MKKVLVITISLGILVMLGSFGVGIENVFATICDRTVEVEDKDQSFIYIKNVTITAKPSKGNVITCVTDHDGECTLEGLLEHTSYVIGVKENSIPDGYECENRSRDCETSIIACNPMKTFKLKNIAVQEPEPAPAPVFQANNLVDLTSEGNNRNNHCVDSCPKVPCKSRCVISTGGCCKSVATEGGGSTCVAYTKYCKCQTCEGPDPCPMDRKNGINDVFNSLDDHYKNVEDDYNKILKSLEQIKEDAASIKDSYKKINSLENINGWIVKDRNITIFDKLNYCRSKMNRCFSQLHEYEVIEKEEVVREILIPCQIGKYEYLTGAENCYGFDMEHLDRAENLLCYHHMGEISLDELAEEEPEPEPEPEEPEEADVILGQIWLDIHKYTYMTLCRDKNKENPSNLGYVDVPNKCCKKHYENSVETKLIDTVRHPDANHYWEKYNCLGY